MGVCMLVWSEACGESMCVIVIVCVSLYMYMGVLVCVCLHLWPCRLKPFGTQTEAMP